MFGKSHINRNIDYRKESVKMPLPETEVNSIAKRARRSDNWYIIGLIGFAILIGAVFTTIAWVNWQDAQSRVNDLLETYNGLNFGNDTDKKMGRWNETIAQRNEIDRTFFNALRDGFFGVGAVLSLASILSTLKEKKKEEQNDRYKLPIKLNQKDIQDIIKKSNFQFDIAFDIPSAVEMDLEEEQPRSSSEGQP